MGVGRINRLIALGAFMVIAFAPQAGAGPKYREVLEIKYLGPGGGQSLCPTDFYNPQNVCISVPIDERARFVTVEMDDVSGNKVFGHLLQESDRGYDSFGEFCGKSEKPQSLPAKGGNLQVFFGPGQCGGGASTPVAGTITFTFSSTR